MLITLLFLDFTGTLHAWFGFLAKIQFLPALLALNFGVVAALIVLTLLFGRVYCSVICPLGVMQDAVSWIAGKRTKNRFRYSPALSWLRYGVLALFIAAAVAGIGSFVALLAPYSAYGRIVSNLIAPLYLWGNNLLAYLAERAGSYAFYRADVWMKGIATLAVAAGTFIILAVVAWHNGRTYCNTICPVGTVLGLFSRFSLLAPVIDTCKCNGCGLCARNCKASCIDPKAHRIDLSRCVACMDCIGKCRQQAIHYRLRTGNAPFRAHPVEPPQQPAKKQIQAETDTTSSPIPPQTGRTRDATVQTQSRPASQDAQVREGLSSNETSAPGISRRNFLSLTAMLTAGSFVRAQEMKVDGGLAAIEEKKIPNRTTPLVPAGARGLWHMARHCTGCQLCVAVCPNGVLRPSSALATLMQPEMSYERGYCRPECTKCAEVCPAGAIHEITPADKSAIQIGHAVWIRENCVPLRDGVDCGNCARHCPTGAILMVPSDPEMSDSPKIPAVNEEKCIGCGACENLCPARPFSAIYVEGHRRHRII